MRLKQGPNEIAVVVATWLRRSSANKRMQSSGRCSCEPVRQCPPARYVQPWHQLRQWVQHKCPLMQAWMRQDQPCGVQFQSTHQQQVQIQRSRPPAAAPDPAMATLQLQQPSQQLRWGQSGFQLGHRVGVMILVLRPQRRVEIKAGAAPAARPRQAIQTTQCRPQCTPWVTKICTQADIGLHASDYSAAGAFLRRRRRRGRLAGSGRRSTGPCCS